MEDLLRSYLNLALAVALLVLNHFFVPAEFAIIKLRASRLETLVRRGNLFAKSARHVVQHIDTYLSLTQLGITACSLGIGWVGEPAVAVMVDPLLEWVGVDSPATIHSLSFAI